MPDLHCAVVPARWPAVAAPLLSALLAAAPQTAGAENTAPALLPKVTVHARGEDAGAAAPSPAQHVTLYDEADLAVGRERSLDEVLRGEPGLAMSKAGEGLGVVYLRGAGGQGLVTLDGIPFPDTVPGLLNLHALVPDGLESMEVSRGFAPASRAFPSLGGAIRLTSREAVADSFGARVEGGTFGTLRETLRGDLAGENARIAVTLNRSDEFDGAYYAQKDKGNPERDPLRDSQALLKAGLDLGDAVTWEGSMLYRSSWHGWDGLGFRDGDLAVVDDEKAFFAEEAWMAQNTLTARLNEDWHSRLQLGFTQTRNRGRTAVLLPGLNVGVNLGHATNLYLARWENDQRLWHGTGENALRLVWGAEGRHERGERPATIDRLTLAPTLPFTEERNQAAGFLETRFVFGSWSGDLGVRYEGYDRFGDHALLHAGLAWQMTPTLKLSANGGNGFRIPSYAERLFPLIGRLDIKPERGAGGDLGLEWRPTSGTRLNLTGFYQRYDDLITLTWNPLAQSGPALPCAGPCLFNVPNAGVAGLEAGAEIVFNAQWRGGAAYTYTDSRNLDSDRRLPMRPRDSARLWGEWHPAALPLTLWTEGVYRGRGQNDLNNTVDVDDAFYVNAQASYRVSPQLSVYVRGENLADDKTPDAFTYDHPGRAVYGGVELRL